MTFLFLSHRAIAQNSKIDSLQKVLKSAMASAKGKNMNQQELYVKEVRADGGPSYKRIMTRSMGRADRIVKRTSHITMILGEKSVSAVRQEKVQTEPKMEKKKFFGKGQSATRKEKVLKGQK